MNTVRWLTKSARRGWRLDRRNAHDPATAMDLALALGMAVSHASAPKPEPARLVGWI
jgi:hypothetical protein